jgi:hypothetical protein
MTRSRRLRRSLPDEEWLERFVAGESLRSLGRELVVPHTTLSRRLGRAESRPQLREARLRHQAKRRASRKQRSEEKRVEKEVRIRARAEAKLDRAHAAWRRSAKPIRHSEQAAGRINQAIDSGDYEKLKDALAKSDAQVADAITT